MTPRTASILGGAFLALAGHLALIHHFGTPLAFRDQWQATAIDLLGPWSRGELSWHSFFTPLNDHWPVLTRLLSCALTFLNGQWNNLVETTFNALLFAAGVALFLRLVLPALTGWTRPVFALVAGLVLALPITWENTLWGIQSLVYSQIVLTLAYLGAVSTQTRFSRLWWLGHAAGVLVLFSQHSAILAHFAAAFVLAWRLYRKNGDRRVTLAGLTFALVVIVAFFAFFPSLSTTAALRADSWPLFLEVFLRQLAWPLPHPAWAIVVYLPWLVFAADRLFRRTLAPTDAFILCLGLWVGAQAAAIGYGRAAETYTFASRYCDFLALGWLLNLACLLLLCRSLLASDLSAKKSLRLALLAFTAFWFIAPLKSFHWETFESHAGFNLSQRPAINQRNLDRLRAFFSTHNSAVLTDDSGTAQELFTYPPALLPLLSNEKFQSLLPPETASPHARPDHGRLRWLSAFLLPTAPFIALAALALLGWSFLRERRTATTPNATTPNSTSPESSSLALLPQLLLLTLIFLLSAALWLAWREPLNFRRTPRLRDAYAPVRPGVTFHDLAFSRGDLPNHRRVPHAWTAVDTLPLRLRNQWHGTRLPGPEDFRGILVSDPIHIRSRHLVTLFSGYPCFPGNGLRWRFVDPATQQETWASYVGNDPGTSFNIWNLDVSAHLGSDATLHLYDGNDGESGWLGVTRPAQTDDPHFAAEWLARLRAERAETTHDALAFVTITSGAFLVALLLIPRPRRLILRRSPTPISPCAS